MKLHVEVTAEDIHYGATGSPDCCPVALALRRHCGRASVGTTAVSLFPPDADVQQVGLPADVQDFILQFDAGQKVEPFAFDLDLPD